MYKHGSEDFIVKIVNRKRLAKWILLLLSFFPDWETGSQRSQLVCTKLNNFKCWECSSDTGDPNI